MPPPPREYKLSSADLDDLAAPRRGEERGRGFPARHDEGAAGHDDNLLNRNSPPAAHGRARAAT